jgi:hypothetical protein
VWRPLGKCWAICTQLGAHSKFNHLQTQVSTIIYAAMEPNSYDDVGKYPILSRRKIEGLIAEGNLIVIMNKSVLRVNSWIKYHPGGEKTIEHMVGRDATDEIVASVTLHGLEIMMQNLELIINE